MKACQALADAGAAVQKAAAAKDVAAYQAAAGGINATCQGCHSVYRQRGGGGGHNRHVSRHHGWLYSAFVLFSELATRSIPHAAAPGPCAMKVEVPMLRHELCRRHGVCAAVASVMEDRVHLPD